MFETLNKRFRPRGWPTEVEVRELVTDDVLPFFMNGPVDARLIQRHLTHLATYTLEGERVFASPDDIGRVPARMFPGLAEITAEVMRLNAPTLEGDGANPT